MDATRCAGPDCGRSIRSAPGPGRPRRYCSDGCRKRAAALVAAASRDLALETVPGSPDAMLAALRAAEFLRDHERGRMPVQTRVQLRRRIVRLSRRLESGW